MEKHRLYSVSLQWEISIQLHLLLLKTLNKPHKFLVLPCVLFLTWKRVKLQTIPKKKEFYAACQGKICVFICKTLSWSIPFCHFCFYTPCCNFLLLHYLREPYSSIHYFVWHEHSSSLLAFNRDPDVNGLGNPTLLYLFSHIEFIKQQMARDSVQFVRFESIDLHGVSRSKNVPSRFFQVSFLVSSCTFMCFHAPILK